MSLIRIYEGELTPTQTEVVLDHFPGQDILVFLDGIQIEAYTLSGRTLTLDEEAGVVRCAVYSGYGGSIAPKSYIDEKFDGLVTPEELAAGLDTKLSENGGAVGRLYLAHDPVDDREPITLEFFEAQEFGMVQSDIETLISGFIVEADVNNKLQDYVNKNLIGAISGVAPLDASKKVPAINLPDTFQTKIFETSTEAGMLSLNTSVGDIVIRTDNPKRVFIKATAGTGIGNFKVIAFFNAQDITFVAPSGTSFTTQTNVQSALAYLDTTMLRQADIDEVVDELVTSEDFEDHLENYNNPHKVSHQATDPIGANEASTDTVRNKHLSDNDILQLHGHRNITSGNPHGTNHAHVMSAAYEVDTSSTDTVKNKHVSNKIIRDLQLGTGFHAANHGINGNDKIAPADIGAAPADNVVIGSSLDYWGTTDPAGGKWMIMDGRLLLRSAYPELYAVLGKRHGHTIDSGANANFRLPDPRGRVLIAETAQIVGTSGVLDTGISPSRTLADVTVDANATGKLGAETHTLTLAQTPAHNHGGFTDQIYQSGKRQHTHGTNANTGFQDNTNLNGNGGRGMNGNATINSTDIDHTHAIASAGDGNAHNNMQSSMVCRMIMRVKP